MANCNDLSLSFGNKKRSSGDHLKPYTDRLLSTNKWAQYQVDRWFRSFSAPNTKPKLRSQIRSTFIPNLSSHKTAEKVANGKSH